MGSRAVERRGEAIPGWADDLNILSGWGSESTTLTSYTILVPWPNLRNLRGPV